MASLDVAGQRTDRYDGVAVALHWIIFLMIIALFASAQIAEELPRESRRALMEWHKLGGLIAFALIAVRLAWRQVRGVPEPIENSRMLGFLARVAHVLFYVLLIALPLSGLGYVISAGRGIGLLGIAPIMAEAPAWKALFHTVHEGAMKALIGLTLLHVVAALFHQYVRHDGTLARMLPWLRNRA